MTKADDLAAGFDPWPYFDAIHEALATAPVAAGPEQGPLVAESRELLRLFVQIGNDDLRRALVDLIRAMLDPAQSLTSGVPSAPRPTGANRSA